MPLDVTKFSKTSEIGKLAIAVGNALASLEAQLNGRPETYVNQQGEIPIGTKPNDLLALLGKRTGKMEIHIVQGKRTSRKLKIEDLGGPYAAAGSMQFIGIVSRASIGPPNATDFANTNDYGFFIDTTGPFYYLAWNTGAGVKSVQLV